MLRLIAGVLAAALSLAALPAVAEEAITSFDTTVELRSDSSVDVTEDITVNVEGIEIRRGIYRDIPTGYLNPSGVRARSDLDIVAVQLDGAPAPYTVEKLDADFRRIRIGDPDVLIEHGQHTYTIHYTMTRMARSFADHDELYWNATGNYWSFPIDEASATLVLPEGAQISDLAGYTGPVGSTEEASEVVERGANRAVLRTTRPLAAGEGFSVAAAFQKGLLAPAGGSTAALNFLSDYRGYYLPVLGLLAVFGVNYWAWNRVGRDPKRGTIIPLFHPPKGMSPAQMHYVSFFGFRQNGWKALTAAIFDLGVKGLLTIENSAKKLTVHAAGVDPAAPGLGDGALAMALPPGEAELASYFRSRGTVTIDKAIGRELEKQRQGFVAAVKSDSGTRFFRHNAGHALLAYGVTLLVLLLLVWFDVIPTFWVIAGAVLGLVGWAVSQFGNIFSPGLGFRRIFTVIWVAVIAINVIGGLGGVLSGFHMDVPALGAVSIIAVNAVFMALMRSSTPEGRKVMDEIEGFKMYLETAEKERLNIAGEPPMTIRRFEAILPFAIALGVEKPWSDHFEGELARNAVADASGRSYQPMWYSGSNFSSGKLSNTIASVSSGMAAAMIAAQPVSSSSSGFGGSSGGSGGGGGGGGGGGW